MNWHSGKRAEKCGGGAGLKVRGAKVLNPAFSGWGQRKCHLSPAETDTHAKN